MIDILGIGEALIEFAQVGNDSYKQSFAGDVLNTLYYASKFGLSTSFFSTFGADGYTTDLQNFLTASKIDYSLCSISKDKNNGLYIIRNAANGDPEFTFFRSDSAAKTSFSQAKKILPKTKIVLSSAIALAILNDRKRFFETLTLLGVNSTIYFDLNVRSRLWTNKNDLINLLPDLASRIHILSLSRSDDKSLFGERTVRDITRSYEWLGFRHVILRDEANDVCLRIEGQTEFVPLEPVETVIDATGAGDAFNAGYLYGWLQGYDPIACADLGNQSARQVLTEKGGIVKTFTPPAFNP